jgi:hypothetical protein
MKLIPVYWEVRRIGRIERRGLRRGIEGGMARALFVL